MTLQTFKRYFKNELSFLYSERESAFLYQIFLNEIVGFDTVQQRRFSYQELLKSDEEKLLQIIEELKSGKPYQQLLGYTEFYGLKFFVDENVLIPRPETEELIEFCISQLKDRKNESLKILDIGTGSGVIPIVLKKHFPHASITAIDVSKKAIEIAEKNAAFHQCPIHFLEMDFLEEQVNEKVDVIISNPPYIGLNEVDEIADSVKHFEPISALFSPTEDALVFYRKIANCINILNENGMVFLEINQKLGKETLALSQDFSTANLYQDISRNDRIVWAIK